MYARICHGENLRLAYRKAARGKRGQRAAAAFEYHRAAPFRDQVEEREVEALAGKGTRPDRMRQGKDLSRFVGRLPGSTSLRLAWSGQI